MVMQIAETSKHSHVLKALECGTESDEFNKNLNLSLQGLRDLYEQTDAVKEPSLKEHSSLDMDQKDDEVVILDDTQISQKLCNEIKQNKFTINDNIRNSFKDIMSNVKNGKLTKPTEEINKAFDNIISKIQPNEQKPDSEINGSSPSVFTEKNTGNNLFENFKNINNATNGQDKESSMVTNGVEKDDNPEVIDLDDSLEEELLKSNDDVLSQKVLTETEEELLKSDTDVSSLKTSESENKTLKSDNDAPFPKSIKDTEVEILESKDDASSSRTSTENEDELLKSNSNVQSPKTSVETPCNDNENKEEDKLLQMDTDTNDVKTSSENDLKDENKLLELDNENSNHSVTSVKSNHSIKSNHSNHSIHSVKSVTSTHSEEGHDSTKSPLPLSESRSHSPCHTNNDIEMIDDELSNQSIKSNISQKSSNSDAKNYNKDSLLENAVNGDSNLSANSNSVKTDNENSPSDDKALNNENSNHSLKSEGEGKDGNNDEHISDTAKDDKCLDINTENENSNHSCKLKSDKIENSNENIINIDTNNSSISNTTDQKDDIKSVGSSLGDDKETSETDNKSMVIKQDTPQSSGLQDGKDNKMDVDSESESDSSSSTSPSSNDTNTEQCSIKTPSCDSEPKSIESEVSENCDKNENNSGEIDRKRPADEAEPLSSQPKRSRLDEMIGKLGSQIGIPLDKVKTLDDLSDTDASHMDSEITESKSDTEDTYTSATETDDESEEVKTPVQSPRKAIRVSQRELSTLVKAQVMLYLRTYRDETIKDLHRKIDELQGTNDMWKNKARDLERKMLELTVLQQKHEKRKAKTAALRQISSKSIGVQVDENKVERNKEIIVQQQNSTPNKNINKTPPRAVIGHTPPKVPAMVTQMVKPGTTPPVVTQPPRTSMPIMVPSQAMVSLPSNTKLIPIPSNIPGSTSVVSSQPSNVQALNIPINIQTNLPQGQILLSPTSIRPPIPTDKTVKSLLASSRQQQPPTTLSQPQAVLYPAGYPKVGQQQQFIMVTSTPSSVTAVKTPVAATSVTSVPRLPAKIIDLTDEEESSKANKTIPTVVTSITNPAGIVRTVAPPQQATGLPPQSFILQGTAQTPRFVNNPQQQVQLVFSGNPPIRPGNLLQVVTAPTTNGGIRTSLAPQQPGVPPPQLRPGQYAPVMTSVPRSSAPTTVIPGAVPQNRATRPPPPLQSAPNNQATRPPVSLPPQPTKKLTHPAPLPPQASPVVIKPGEKPLAPKPTLKISRVSQGIVLSWNMNYIPKNHAEIQSYQLFAYQETSAAPVYTLWKKVGDVKALPLPMACTLTQFQEGNRYHFAVRPMDIHGRAGPFSDPSSIHLMPMK